MSDTSADSLSNSNVEQQRQMIVEARGRGKGSLMWVFTKLSGPGWLQSAITLGGGSLGGSLYLGVLAGFGLMWLQPLMMILGVVMLSAIGYVALSTGERPFRAVNSHVSPVLGWGWALATMMANFVWCMPQFSLGVAAIQQNLAPAALGPVAAQVAVAEAVEASPTKSLTSDEQATIKGSVEFKNKLICSALLFCSAFVIVWFYNSGGWGIRMFEWVLKGMVGIVVISFFAVVAKMTLSGGLDWGQILSGFIPDLSLLSQPGEKLRPLVSATGEFADFWSNMIVGKQQKVMITAAATAVGINMTFLLPYSMLSRGWDKDFRGLAVFDLATGLFVPFLLATGCVVLASAAQFYGKQEVGLVAIYNPQAEVLPADAPPVDGKLKNSFDSLLDARLASEPQYKEKIKSLHATAKKNETAADKEAAKAANEELVTLRKTTSVEDMQIAAALVERDNFHLANSLKGLVGEGMAQTLFGIGVLGMAVSTIIILMLINGFVVCEMLGLPPQGMPHRFAAAAAGLVGALGPFFWSKAAAYLVVPTSMFGMVLLPIAYWTFFFMMNSESLMGKNMPRGAARWRWNVLMIIASGTATFGSAWSVLNSDVPVLGFSLLGAFILLAIIVRLMKKNPTTAS